MKRVAYIFGIGVVVIAIGVLVLGGDDNKRSPIWDYMPRAISAVFGPKPVKEFAMIDHNMQSVTHETYTGKYLLTFFGYTYCPDVCPTGLSDISQALDILGPNAEKIIPVFVTVDPNRDTPEILKEYLENFHPKFVGLTGTKAQIDTLAKIYKARYVKMKTEDDDPGTYYMGHTSTIFLTGPDQQLITSYNRDVKPEAMALSLKSILLR